MTPSLEGLPTNAKEAPSGPAGHQPSIYMSQGKSGPDFTALEVKYHGTIKPT